MWQQAEDAYDYIPLHMLVKIVLIIGLFACAIQYGESRWFADFEKQQRIERAK